MPVKFIDNSIQVKGTLDDTAIAFLYESIEELHEQTVKNTKPVTERTKGSFREYVDETKMEAYVGSDYKNAIYEELGTGEFAANGDGRKSPWRYQDPTTGKWYTTTGKKPRHMLLNAFKSKKNAIQNRAKSLFGGMGK